MEERVAAHATKSLALAIAAASMLPLASRAADTLPPQVNGNLGGAVQCSTLSALSLPNATVTVAQSNTDGQFAIPNSTTIIRNLPAFCRVHVVVKPAINIEVWMPSTGWNGKLLAVEPGGTLGSISYGNTVDLAALTNAAGVTGLADGLQRGYAMMSTDGGHVSADNTWWTDLGRAVDLGYRAGHEMTVKGKMVVAAFYATPPGLTYFDACSGGGRVAMMEAQRYPEDYDGIVAGDPGFNWNDLMVAELWASRATTDSPAANLPNSKLQMITDAAVAACDTIDGVRDGIIDDPRNCHFDPSVLQCSGADAATCLTAGQVDAVRKIYAGASSPDGKRISYGHEPGSETGWANMYTGVSDVNTQGGVSDRLFYKLMIFGDPNYDLKTFDYNNDVDFTNDKTAWLMNATNPDLSGFKARGGKLIEYYGWADGLAPSGATPDYYDQVVATMGGRSAVQSFYRLFMVPGMGHCSGGYGPNKFDALKALEAWVEKGAAPDKIVAARVTNGFVDMTRPFCPYPQVARYTGSGFTSVGTNFYCINPKNGSSSVE